MRVVFSTDARRDRREAESYYKSVSPALRAAFRADLDAALRYITDYPEGAPVLLGSTHAKTLVRFPYSVLYKAFNDRIFIVGVANQARDPMRYVDRLT